MFFSRFFLFSFIIHIVLFFFIFKGLNSKQYKKEIKHINIINSEIIGLLDQNSSKIIVQEKINLEKAEIEKSKRFEDIKLAQDNIEKKQDDFIKEIEEEVKNSDLKIEEKKDHNDKLEEFKKDEAQEKINEQKKNEKLSEQRAVEDNLSEKHEQNNNLIKKDDEKLEKKDIKKNDNKKIEKKPNNENIKKNIKKIDKKDKKNVLKKDIKKKNLNQAEKKTITGFAEKLKKTEKIINEAEKNKNGSNVNTSEEFSSEDMASLAAFIKTKIIQCWSVPPSVGVLRSQKIYVIIRIELNKSGEVKDFQIINNLQYAHDDFFHIIEKSAIEAIKKCSPILGLPEERYSDWNQVELIFDPSELS